MYAASTKQPENLSQSALSYLQSLDKAAKALRQNQATEKTAISTPVHHESSRLSTGRSSLSLMISELRQKTRKDSTIDESDDNQSTSGRRSHLSGKTPSIESSSSTGEERIVFDFPFDGDKEDNKKISTVSHELPGLQLGRKSISELRELRTSIDHSLIKPPTLQKQNNTRRRLSSTSRKGSDLRDESESEEQFVATKQNVVKTKSPFRPAIESGSDVESIDFEEDLPKAKLVRFKDSRKSSKNSSNASSSRSTTSSSHSSSVSELSFTSKAASASSSSSRSSSASTSSSSTVVTKKSRSSSKFSSGSTTPQVFTAGDKEVDRGSGSPTSRDYSDFESISTDDNASGEGPSSIRTAEVQRAHYGDEYSNKIEAKSPSTISESPLELAVKPKSVEAVSLVQSEKLKSPKRVSSHTHSPTAIRDRQPQSPSRISRKHAPITRTSSEHIHLAPANVPKEVRGRNGTDDCTQTEEREERRFPEFCSSNVHHVTKDVLRTHLRLLKEFNRLEWTSLQEWNAILDDIREKYDGPSTEKLKAVIEKRTRQFNTE